LGRHRQADGCGEIFLPEIEREEPFGFESDGGSSVEDIEAPVPARPSQESARRECASLA